MWRTFFTECPFGFVCGHGAHITNSWVTNERKFLNKWMNYHKCRCFYTGLLHYTIKLLCWVVCMKMLSTSSWPLFLISKGKYPSFLWKVRWLLRGTAENIHSNKGKVQVEILMVPQSVSEPREQIWPRLATCQILDVLHKLQHHK